MGLGDFNPGGCCCNECQGYFDDQGEYAFMASNDWDEAFGGATPDFTNMNGDGDGSRGGNYSGVWLLGLTGPNTFDGLGSRQQDWDVGNGYKFRIRFDTYINGGFNLSQTAIGCEVFAAGNNGTKKIINFNHTSTGDISLIVADGLDGDKTCTQNIDAGAEITARWNTWEIVAEQIAPEVGLLARYKVDLFRGIYKDCSLEVDLPIDCAHFFWFTAAGPIAGTKTAWDEDPKRGSAIDDVSYQESI